MINIKNVNEVWSKDLHSQFPWSLRLLRDEWCDAIHKTLVSQKGLSAVEKLVTECETHMQKVPDARESASSYREIDRYVLKNLSRLSRELHRTLSSRSRRVASVVQMPLSADECIELRHDVGSFFELLEYLPSLELDIDRNLWHSKKEMNEVTVTEDCQDANYVTQLVDALSRLDDSGLATAFAGLSEECLRRVIKTAIATPAATKLLERDIPGMGTLVRKILVEGAGSLTHHEFRTLQNFEANRLKEKGSDLCVEERAIANDIFLPARTLFPDRITSPSDVDAGSLTALFAEKAEAPEVNEKPLSRAQLTAIKDLSQAWRKHFQHVKYRGEKVNLSPAGEDGLLFRTTGAKRKSLGTNKFWPNLEF